MSTSGNNRNNGRAKYGDFIAFNKAKAENAKDLRDQKTPPKVFEPWLPISSNFPNPNLDVFKPLVWGRPDGKNPDEWFKHAQIGPLAPGWASLNLSTLKPN